MTYIKVTKEPDGGTRFEVGDHTIAVITPVTPAKAVKKFEELCIANEVELLRLGVEYEDRVTWNLNSKGQGKDWPIFREREKFVNRLLGWAGVKDS